MDNSLRSRHRQPFRRRAPFGLVLLLALAACHSPSQELHIPPSQPVPDQPLLTGTKADDEKLSHIAAVSAQSGNYASAVELYKRLANDRPRDFEIQLAYGDALVGNGNFTDAINAYKTASTLMPHDSRPYIGLCRIDLAQHRPADALAVADQALVNGAGQPNIYSAKGIALDTMGRHAEAQAAYQQGLKLTPADPDIQNNYALSLTMSGQYEQAINILTRLVQQPGATERQRQNLALALGLQGNANAARMIASRDLSPADVDNNLRYYELVRSGSTFSGK